MESKGWYQAGSSGGKEPENSSIQKQTDYNVQYTKKLVNKYERILLDVWDINFNVHVDPF